MIHEIINTKTNQVVITLPAEFIDRELELMIFPAPKRDKKETKRMMERVFKNAEKIDVADDIDIDDIMNEMNDALP
ncbi:MAG: hypothetical protein HQK65_21720 [Desulfamplus sp.]|nr:hypothetical protein [Desulfamplus sp.]